MIRTRCYETKFETRTSVFLEKEGNICQNYWSCLPEDKIPLDETFTMRNYEQIHMGVVYVSRYCKEQDQQIPSHMQFIF